MCITPEETGVIYSHKAEGPSLKFKDELWIIPIKEPCATQDRCAGATQNEILWDIKGHPSKCLLVLLEWTCFWYILYTSYAESGIPNTDY